MSTPASQVNPLLGVLTNKTNLTPLINAINQGTNTQVNSINTANNQAQAGLVNQIGSLQGGYNQSAAIQNPYINAGNGALGMASGIAGAMSPQQYDQLLQNPQLQAILKQGTNQLQQNASAQGSRLSPAAQLNLQKMAQQNTANFLQQQYQQNLGLAQLGQGAAGQLSNQAYGLGGAIGAVNQQQGSTNANATLAKGSTTAQGGIDAANAQVAQSTIAGLNPGAIANTGNGASQLPVVQGGYTNTPSQSLIPTGGATDTTGHNVPGGGPGASATDQAGGGGAGTTPTGGLGTGSDLGGASSGGGGGTSSAFLGANTGASSPGYTAGSGASSSIDSGLNSGLSGAIGGSSSGPVMGQGGNTSGHGNLTNAYTNGNGSSIDQLLNSGNNTNQQIQSGLNSGLDQSQQQQQHVATTLGISPDKLQAGLSAGAKQVTLGGKQFMYIPSGAVAAAMGTSKWGYIPL